MCIIASAPGMNTRQSRHAGVRLPPGLAGTRAVVAVRDRRKGLRARPMPQPHSAYALALGRETSAVGNNFGGELVNLALLAAGEAAHHLERHIRRNTATDTHRSLRLLENDAALQRRPKLLVLRLERGQPLKHVGGDASVTFQLPRHP